MRLAHRTPGLLINATCNYQAVRMSTARLDLRIVAGDVERVSSSGGKTAVDRSTSAAVSRTDAVTAKALLFGSLVPEFVSYSSFFISRSL